MCLIHCTVAAFWEAKEDRWTAREFAQEPLTNRNRTFILAEYGFLTREGKNCDIHRPSPTVGTWSGRNMAYTSHSTCLSNRGGASFYAPSSLKGISNRAPKKGGWKRERRRATSPPPRSRSRSQSSWTRAAPICIISKCPRKSSLHLVIFAPLSAQVFRFIPQLMIYMSVLTLVCLSQSW